MTREIGKFLNFAARRLLPGGVVFSKGGTRIEISANGTSTVSPDELKAVLLKHFADMSEVDPGTHVRMSGEIELPEVASESSQEEFRVHEI